MSRLEGMLSSDEVDVRVMGASLGASDGDSWLNALRMSPRRGPFSLCLWGCSMCEGGLRALMIALRDSRSFERPSSSLLAATYLTELVVIDSNVECEGVKELLLFPNKFSFSTLSTLNLGGNFLGDDGAIVVAHAIENHQLHALENLMLEGCRIGPVGCVALAHALQRCPPPKLCVLNLSWNNIGDEGVRELCAMLASGRLLSLVQLSVRGLAEETAQQLKNAAAQAGNSTTVDTLSGNNLHANTNAVPLPLTNLNTDVVLDNEPQAGLDFGLTSPTTVDINIHNKRRTHERSTQSNNNNNKRTRSSPRGRTPPLSTSSSSSYAKTSPFSLDSPQPDQQYQQHRGAWTTSEDAQLVHAIKKYGAQSWKQVASVVLTRTDIQCQQRWCKVLDPSIRKGSWGMEEDKLLIIGVANLGQKAWSKIAETIPGRNAKQVRERWIMSLNPDIVRTPWTPAEDNKLLELAFERGFSWADIQETHFPNRCPNQLKTRYKSLHRALKKDEGLGKRWNNALEQRVDALTDTYDTMLQVRRRLPKPLKGVSYHVLCQISQKFKLKFPEEQTPSEAPGASNYSKKSVPGLGLLAVAASIFNQDAQE